MLFSGKVYGKKRQKESFYFLADTKKKKGASEGTRSAAGGDAGRGQGRADCREAGRELRGADDSHFLRRRRHARGAGERRRDQAAGAVKRGLRAGAAVAAAIPGDDLQGGAAVRGERRAKPWGLRPCGDCRDLQAVMKQAGGFVRAWLSDGEQWRGPVVLPAEGAVMRGTFGGGCAAAENAACRRRCTKLRFRHDEG